MEREYLLEIIKEFIEKVEVDIAHNIIATYKGYYLIDKLESLMMFIDDKPLIHTALEFKGIKETYTIMR
jgi:hypothetical protein